MDRFTNERLCHSIGTIGLARLGRALLNLIASCRIYCVFQIKAGTFRKRYRSCNRFAKEKSLTITKILLNIAPNMQVEYSATPLLTEDKASSLPCQFCKFHPLSAHLVCDCSNKSALRKSKQPWSQDCMFVTFYKKECYFFMWVDQPISHGIKERLSYSLQPHITRIHPYGEIKKMFEKRRQEAKQKAFIQKFYVQKVKEDSRRPRCYTLSKERRCVTSGVLQVRKRGRVSPRKLPSLGGFV